MPSSVIRRFDYDEPSRRLDVQFVTGRRYSYHDVPATLVEAMRSARSKGQFFNARIRDHFRFTRETTGCIFVGTAGWSIASRDRPEFPHGGSHLERYAARFNAVEINSSFHRPHRFDTYRRWAETVPPEFRFSVKLPKQITHQLRLVDSERHIETFADQIAGLGEKLGAVLVQLPPKLAFDAGVANAFLAALRAAIAAPIAWEPRHASWFTPEAEASLAERRVARVAADPARVPEASDPGGWPGLRYFRLHGSPVIYRSAYGEGRLRGYAATLRAGSACDSWCIFDNTAAMAAIGDALMFARIMAEQG